MAWPKVGDWVEFTRKKWQGIEEGEKRQITRLYDRHTYEQGEFRLAKVGPFVLWFDEEGTMFGPSLSPVLGHVVEVGEDDIQDEAMMPKKRESKSMAGIVKKSYAGKVQRDGDTVTLSGMGVPEMIKALAKMHEQDETEVAINAEFPNLFLTEGLIAFSEVLESRYGAVFTEPGGFFSAPPTLLDIEVGPGKVRQVIWGKFGVPGMQGQFETSIGWRQLGTSNYNTPIFVLSGTVKQKFKGEVEELVEAVKAWGAKHSIYKGRALELRFPDPDTVKSPLEYAPRFMPVDKTIAPPVFNAETQAVIDNYIFEDIEATALTLKNGLPIKKGILVEGPPGTGKTLLAHTIAGKCEEFGWTFCYLKDVKDIAQAVELTQLVGWGPAFVFAEDVDRVVGMDRTDAVNKVLNVIDGIDGKNSQVVVLFTTNDIDVIHKTMLRPGRLDVLISVNAPDAGTVEQLIRREAGLGLALSADLTAVGEELSGTMPAVVVQVVQRAARAAQRRLRLSGAPEVLCINPELTAEDLLIAAKSMRSHIERLKPVPKDERTPIEKAAATMGDAVMTAMKAQVESAFPFPNGLPLAARNGDARGHGAIRDGASGDRKVTVGGSGRIGGKDTE